MRAHVEKRKERSSDFAACSSIVSVTSLSKRVLVTGDYCSVSLRQILHASIMSRPFSVVL